MLVSRLPEARSETPALNVPKVSLTRNHSERYAGWQATDVSTHLRQLRRSAADANYSPSWARR